MSKTITVLIPAHNEEKIIQQTIESVFTQTRMPDQVIVISDNSSDNTVKIAQKMKEIYGESLIIYETIDNKTKKAGALNQVLNKFTLSDFILVMDADTVLDKNVLKEGMKYMKNEVMIGAVCSKAGLLPYEGDSRWGKLLWYLQHLEYGTFDSYRVETYEKVKVCHGMCTLFRAEALRSVKSFRKAWLDIDIGYFDEHNLVEDLELTTCVAQNWKTAVNLNMLAFTEVPVSLKELWIQRTRWFRGGIDCIKTHGINKVTKYEILGHILFILKLVLTILIWAMTINFYFAYGFTMTVSLPFLCIMALGVYNSLYRIKYVHNWNKWDVIIRLSIIPETLYYWFNSVALIKSYYMVLLNIKQKW